MKKAILLLLIASPFLSVAQPLFTLPLEKKNPYQQNLFVDNDGFSVAVLEYASLNMAFFLKPGSGKLSGSEIDGEGNKFEGFSSNEHEFNVYFITTLKKRKVATFYKDSKSPEVKDVSIPTLQPKDKDYIHFVRNDKFYKIFKSNKSNQLSIYEFSGSTGKNIGTFTVPENTFKDLDDHTFKYIPEHGNVALDLLSGDKLYWSGDSLIFAYHKLKGVDRTKDKHLYVSLNFGKKSVSERVIMTGIKTSSVNDFLLGDKIFLAYTYHYPRVNSSNPNRPASLTSFRYDDSLFLDVLNVHSLQKIKRLKMSPETGIDLKSTPFFSTSGDTLENKWKQEDRQRKLFIELYAYPLFIQAVKNSAGGYVITMGAQTYYSHSHSAAGPGGAAGGGVTTTTVGPQEYFKGCLSDTFDLAACQDVIAPQDKAIVRKSRLEREVVSKGLYHKRYGDFQTSYNSQYFYLMYIEKDTKTLFIEQF